MIFREYESIRIRNIFRDGSFGGINTQYYFSIGHFPELALFIVKRYGDVTPEQIGVIHVEIKRFTGKDGGNDTLLARIDKILNPNKK